MFTLVCHSMSPAKLNQIPEDFTQPVFKLRDPSTLRMKKSAKDMSFDTVVRLFGMTCVFLPIAFTIAWKNPAYLLQLAYLPFALLISPIVFNFSPVNRWMSNVIHFMPVLILLIPIAFIHHIVPSPSWYIAVVPLQLILSWFTSPKRWLAKIKRREWQEFSRFTG
jgi:hypothetical protein